MKVRERANLQGENPCNGRTGNAGVSSEIDACTDKKIFHTIDENFEYIRSILGGIGLVTTQYCILSGKAQAGVAYIDSLADKELINRHVLVPLLQKKVDPTGDISNIIMLVQTQLLSTSGIYSTSMMDMAIQELINGETVLFFDHSNTSLIIESRKTEKRPVEQASSEVTISGSKESFTEDLSVNCSMVIKRLPTPALHLEEFNVGRHSKTKVKFIWFEGITNQITVKEARDRIQRIDTDFIEGIGQLSQLIEDRPMSLFPKSLQTERPDLVANYLVRGSFAILCDYSPFALIGPITLWTNFVSMDDYAEFPLLASYFRIVRITAAFISITIAPLYLAFVAYNHEIIPTGLAISIATGREGIPFPSVVEIALMTFIISIIYEAGIRIPGTVGFFVGSLAAVIIGQAAVSAGYVSASLIIVIAITTISSFAISRSKLIHAARIINYIFIFLASVFGMFGLINGVIFLTWYLVSLKSFGMPYLYPVVPISTEGILDTLIRAPYNVLKKHLRISDPFNGIRSGKENVKGRKKER